MNGIRDRAVVSMTDMVI